MPFTFAHPAIVIPLSKINLKLSLTGLIVGSMVPDFEFFIRMVAFWTVGHHAYGILVFDIPLAIALCFIFHNHVRNLLISNLPNWFRSRFYVFTTFNWNTYAASHKITILISITIGVFSHLIWDAFTHADGYFVLIIPFLQRTITLFTRTTNIYFLMQIISSIWGLIMVFYYIKGLPICSNGSQEETIYPYWIIMALWTAGILFMRFILLPQHHSFYDIVMACIGSGLWSMVITSSIYKKSKQIKWLVQ